MEYNINYLIRKIEKLNSNSPKNHIREIESLLRDINNQQAIPKHLYKKLALALIKVDEKREYFSGTNVHNTVIHLIDKMNSKPKVNSGEMLANGYNYMRKSFYDPNAAYKILTKFGIPLFPI